MTTPSGISRIPIPRKSRGRLTYIRPAAESTCPQVRRRARRSGATGRQVARAMPNQASPTTDGEDEQRQTRVAQELDQAARARLDRLAEEVGRARAEDAARRHGVGARPPALRPGHRLGPLLFQVGAGRPVEERILELTPAALVGDPRQGGARCRRLARDRDHLRLELEVRAAGVVAADALLAGAADVEGRVEEVRVRAGGRIDDRPAPVDELELLVAPVRRLGALVLAVADGDGILAERLLGVVGVEEELDHLPVALVQVVPVVVGVEEPVLQRQLPGVRRVGRDVGVHGRLVALAQAPVPASRSRSPG